MYDIIDNICLYFIMWGWKVDEVLLRYLVMYIEIVSSFFKCGYLVKIMIGVVVFFLLYIFFFGSKKLFVSILCFWFIFLKFWVWFYDLLFVVFKSFVYKLKINEFKKWNVYLNFIFFSL